ncbi:hypothetical protein AB6A40_002402 [Gnathostoma spinigerum]|uniref:Uncharacterized protein n=1 Tax=Gnathostoma spinigerum TaxID=75299 RepID=A0ABD6E6M8_9BILA
MISKEGEAKMMVSDVISGRFWSMLLVIVWVKGQGMIAISARCDTELPVKISSTSILHQISRAARTLLLPKVFDLFVSNNEEVLRWTVAHKIVLLECIIDDIITKRPINRQGLHYIREFGEMKRLMRQIREYYRDCQRLEEVQDEMQTYEFRTNLDEYKSSCEQYDPYKRLISLRQNVLREDVIERSYLLFGNHFANAFFDLLRDATRICFKMMEPCHRIVGHSELSVSDYKSGLSDLELRINALQRKAVTMSETKSVSITTKASTILSVFLIWMALT